MTLWLSAKHHIRALLHWTIRHKLWKKTKIVYRSSDREGEIWRRKRSSDNAMPTVSRKTTLVDDCKVYLLVLDWTTLLSLHRWLFVSYAAPRTLRPTKQNIQKPLTRDVTAKTGGGGVKNLLVRPTDFSRICRFPKNAQAMRLQKVIHAGTNRARTTHTRTYNPYEQTNKHTHRTHTHTRLPAM